LNRNFESLAFHYREGETTFVYKQLIINLSNPLHYQQVCSFSDNIEFMKPLLDSLCIKSVELISDRLPIELVPSISIGVTKTVQASTETIVSKRLAGISQRLGTYSITQPLADASFYFAIPEVVIDNYTSFVLSVVRKLRLNIQLSKTEPQFLRDNLNLANYLWSLAEVKYLGVFNSCLFKATEITFSGCFQNGSDSLFSQDAYAECSR